MNRRTVLAVLVLLTVFVPGISAAGETRVSQTRRVTETGVEQRVTLELREADVREVLASFGRIVEAEPEIDSDVRGEVTIELHDVRAATALTAVCESVGCLWRIEGGRLDVTPDPDAPAGLGGPPSRAEGPLAAKLGEPIDMDLKDADLRQVLEAFGSIAGVEVEVDQALQGTVTVRLHETPVRQALDALCRVHGCRWELVETEDGPVLRFGPR